MPVVFKDLDTTPIYNFGYLYNIDKWIEYKRCRGGKESKLQNLHAKIFICKLYLEIYHDITDTILDILCNQDFLNLKMYMFTSSLS